MAWDEQRVVLALVEMDDRLRSKDAVQLRKHEKFSLSLREFEPWSTGVTSA